MKINELLKDPKLEQLAREDPRQIIEKMFWIVDKAGKRFLLSSMSRRRSIMRSICQQETTY